MSRRVIVAVCGLVSMICLSLVIGIVIGILLGYREFELDNDGNYRVQNSYGFHIVANKTVTSSQETNNTRVIFDVDHLEDQELTSTQEPVSLLKSTLDNFMNHTNMTLATQPPSKAPARTEVNCNQVNGSTYEDLQECVCDKSIAACFGPKSVPKCARVRLEAFSYCDALKKCASRCAGIYFDGKSYFKFNCYNFQEAASSTESYLLPMPC